MKLFLTLFFFTLEACCTLSWAGEINSPLQKSRSGVEGMSRHLSEAIEGLSHGLRGSPRPTVENEIPTPEVILNGLKQMSREPDRAPPATFEKLKEKEARLKKDLQTWVNLWVHFDSQAPNDKSPAVEKKLLEDRETTRKELLEVQSQIKQQIAGVMNQLGFQSKAPESISFQKGETKVTVRFVDGEIKVEPIVPLPPIESTSAQ